MAHETEHRPKEKLVLLVEDDINIGEVLTQAITQETPYKVLLKSDGPGALDAAETLKPHLFILDYHLPRMTGIELHDRLHAIEDLAQVPTIMISARLPVHELSKRNIIGMNKPIDLDEFLQTIEHLLT